MDVEEGKTYTWVIEIRNATVTGGVLRIRPSLGRANLDKLSDAGAGHTLTEDGMVYAVVTAIDDFSSLTQDTRGYFYVTPGVYADFDARIGIFEGEYTGPYKPYSGKRLYATSAELKVTADGISTEVAKKTDKDTIISTIRQSAETVQIKADQVDIEGAAIFKKDGAYDKSKTVVRTETQ